MEGRFPDCYHFKPKDEELILDYLRKRIENKEELHPKSDFMIKEVDIYKYNPYQLTEIYKDWVLDDNWYFFTPRERKYEKGMRPSRTAGNGTWKASGSDKNVKNELGEKIGDIKTLVYYNGTSKGKEDKTEWIMKEYTDIRHPPRAAADGNKQLDDVVLCVMYKRKMKKEKRFKKSKVTKKSTGDHEELATTNSSLQIF